MGCGGWTDAASAAQLTLTWSDNSTNEYGFRVERRTGTTGAFSVITTVGVDVRSYVDRGLAPGTTYCYRVAAYNANGLSRYANEACATALATQSSSRHGEALHVNGSGRPEAPPGHGVTDTGEALGRVVRAHGPAASGGGVMERGRIDGTPEPVMITGTGPGAPGEVRTFRADGSWTGLSFQPYGPSFVGGVRVASCDVDGDGVDEIVTASGPGRAPAVRVWEVTGMAARQVLGFRAGGQDATNGVFVACGDVDGDGQPEVITGQDGGGPPEVRVYHVTARGAALRARFLATDDGSNGGVRVTVADVDGDGQPEVVTAPGPGAPPIIRVFRLEGSSVAPVMSFEGADPAFTGGLFIAGGSQDLTHGGARLLIAPGAGGLPHVRVLAVSPTMVRDLYGFDADDPEAVIGIAVGVIR